MAISLDDCRKIVADAVSECTDTKMLYLVWNMILGTLEDSTADIDDTEDDEEDFDMMPDILNTREFYTRAIADAVNKCSDNSLLDFVWKLLLSESTDHSEK